MDVVRAGRGPTATVTIVAVAEAAGVSVGTVSHALNHPERLAPETLARVRDQIDRLGFIPHSGARSMATGDSGNVGLIVPDLTNDLFLDVARGAQFSAPQFDLEVLLANSGRSWIRTPDHAERQDRLIRAFAEARVRGLLLAAMQDPSLSLEAIRQHVPALVVLNFDHPQPDWCTVLMDNRSIGRQAVEHLASRGIGTMYFVSPPDIAQPIAERRRGVREAATAAGVHLVEIEVAGVDVEHGLAAGERVISEWRQGDRRGVLGVSDDIALGVLETARATGSLRIPADLAVMGMDAHHRPRGSDWVALSSFHSPGWDIGQAAMRLIRAEIDAATSGEHAHRREVIPVAVAARASTVGTSGVR